jgi:ribosomal protein S18 acetylase RimI-like enzyme
VNVRRATVADEAAIRSLWEEFEAEVPEPAGWTPETWDEEWTDVQVALDDGAVYLAEDGDGAVGVALATPPERGRSHLALVHVRAQARRQGIATELVCACVEEVRAKGADRMSLEVVWSNGLARKVWARLGFEEQLVVMDAGLDALAQRLGGLPVGESHASTHVRTDDRTSVDHAIAEFLPRLESPEAHETANGWIRIASPSLDADRDAQSRLAKELSERLDVDVVALALEAGAVVRYRLYEDGRMVDEYLSVPTFYGPLSKADELALVPNPTIVARLTGADRADVHRIAQTGASVGELPPAADLYKLIAIMMGLEP